MTDTTGWPHELILDEIDRVKYDLLKWYEISDILHKGRIPPKWKSDVTPPSSSAWRRS